MVLVRFFSFIIIGLITFSSISYARTLTAVSDWSVQKIEAAIPYCTVTRQYEADVVLTMAQNVRGEGTIALNFKRNAFDLSRVYPITLKVGSVLRQYVTKPANNANIIMRTGGDQSLFKAMSDSQKLNITIDKEIFDLDISNYSVASSKLSQCLGRKEKPVQVEVKTPRAPIVQNNNIQSDEMDHLIAENKKLVRELGEATKRQPNVKTPIPSSDNIQLLQRLAASEQKNVILMTTINRLEGELRSLKTSVNPDLSSVLTKKDEQIASLITQNEDLQLQVRKLRAISDASTVLPPVSGVVDGDMATRLSEAETQAKVFEVERDEYRRLLQLERERMHEMGGLAGNIQSTENDRKSLTEDIRQLEIEKADLIRKLEFEKASKTAGIPTVSNDSTNALHELSNQLDFMKSELQKLALDKASLSDKLAQSSAAAKAAKDELQAMKLSVPSSDNAPNLDNTIQVQTLRAEIASLEADNALLRQDVEKKIESAKATPVQNTPKVDPVMVKRLHAIEAENKRLMKELAANKATKVRAKTATVTSTPVAQPIPKKSTVKKSETTDLPAVKTQRPMKILSGDLIRQLIGQASISLKGNISRIQKLSQSDFAAFRWDTGVVYGNAEQKRANGAETFDQFVKAYVQKTSQRCQGTFDQTSSIVRAAITARSVDVACIDNNASSGHTASIVLFENSGMFYAIAHEGSVQKFQIAMDMRDRVINSIQQSF